MIGRGEDADGIYNMKLEMYKQIGSLGVQVRGIEFDQSWTRDDLVPRQPEVHLTLLTAIDLFKRKPVLTRERPLPSRLTAPDPKEVVLQIPSPRRRSMLVHIASLRRRRTMIVHVPSPRRRKMLVHIASSPPRKTPVHGAFRRRMLLPRALDCRTNMKRRLLLIRKTSLMYSFFPSLV